MKQIKENLEILKKLGFSCDMNKTKNPMDEDWYSLECGWGFRLDSVRNFKQLFKNALKYKDYE